MRSPNPAPERESDLSERSLLESESINKHAQPVTVLLLDSEQLMRTGLRTLVNSLEGFQVVCEAGNFAEAIALATAKKPDIALVELALQGQSGIEFIHELKRLHLPTRVAIVSHVDAPDMVTQTLLAGAQGFLPKSSSLEDLHTCLQVVSTTKRRYLPQNIAHLEDLASNRYMLDSNSVQDPLAKLSAREREIFHLLASGLQNTVIAKKLFISPRTVETHRARIVRKLEIQSNGELIRFAIKHGLTTI